MSDSIGRITAGNRTSYADKTAPCTGVGAGARILTLDGALPVEFLEPGDRIITRSGARVLRWIAPRICPATMVMQVRPGALGFARPEAPVFFGADQPVLLRDWRARAIYGRTQVMVPLRALADGHFIAPEPTQHKRLFTLGFDRDEVFVVDGLELVAAREPVREAHAA